MKNPTLVFAAIITTVLFIAKLTVAAGMSWWFVFLPFGIWLAFSVLVAALIVLCAAIVAMLAGLQK